MAVSEVFLTHIGGVDSVTGSCTLITIKQGNKIKRILVDFGTYQEKNNEEKNYSIPDEIIPSEIDAVILTHTHADHVGLLGLLSKQGFDGPVYTTQDTAQLLQIQLESCTKVLNNGREHIKKVLNSESRIAKKRMKFNGKIDRRALSSIDELFDAQQGVDYFKYADITDEDIYNVLNNVKAQSYNRVFNLSFGEKFSSVKISFTFNNHMLGSAISEIIIDRDAGIPPTILQFTGDLGRGYIKDDKHLLYGDAQNPDSIFGNKVVITEATYGNECHEKTMQEAEEELLYEICETIKNKGRVIIPAFAMERTQEIIYILNKAKKRDDEIGEIIRSVPITIDSPTAVRFTNLYSTLCNTKRFPNADRESFSTVGINCASFYVDHIKVLNDRSTPQIILTTGGMGDVGRILDYYDIDLENQKSKFLFCGYTSKDTLGSKLINASKDEEIFIRKKLQKIKATIKRIDGFSSHADQRGIIQFIKNGIKKLQGVIIMHGDIEEKEGLKAKIESDTLLTPFIPEKSTVYWLQATGKIEEISAIEREAILFGDKNSLKRGMRHNR